MLGVGAIFHSGTILIIGILGLFLAGFPLAYWVSTFKKDLSAVKADGIWALSVFIGYGFIVTLAKLLYLYINIPLQYSAWLILGAGVTMWCIFVLWYRKKGYGWRQLFPGKKFILLILGLTLLASVTYLYIGSSFYTGYNHYDAFFYGSQAEAVKSIPFSQLSSAWQESPYLLRGGSIHRLGRGLFQAFVATLSFTDGASTGGLMGIICVPLLFCALLYATKDLRMNPILRYAGCALAAFLPSHITTILEAFYVVAIFTCFIPLMCKLFIELFDTPNWGKTVIITLTIDAIFTTFSQSVYFPMGLFLLAFFLCRLYSRCRWRDALHPLFVGLFVYLTNLPLLTIWGVEISAALSTRALDALYPFTTTPSVIPWLLFGKDLLNYPQGFLFNAIFTLVAVLFCLTGLIGLWQCFWQTRKPETILFLVAVFSPLLFLTTPHGESYQLFKMLSFVFPLLMVGVWYLLDVCLQQISPLVNATCLWKKPGVVKNILKTGMVAVVSIPFLFASAQSFLKVLAVVDSNAPAAAGRNELVLDGSTKAYLDTAIPSFQSLQDKKGVNLAFFGDPWLNSWWGLYYARNCNIFIVTPDALSTYSLGRAETLEKYTEEGFPDIPLDCEIYMAPGMKNLVADPAAQKDFAVMLSPNYNVEETSPGIYTHTDSIYVYARQACTILLKDPNPFPGQSLQINHQIDSLVEGSPFEIEIEVPAGASSFDIRYDSYYANIGLPELMATLEFPKNN